MPPPQRPELTLPISQNLMAPLLEMQQLGMSQSVIDSAIRGSYTMAQLEKLVSQRKNVLAVIEQQTGARPAAHQSHSVPTTPQSGNHTAMVDGTNGGSANTTPFGHRYSLRLRELANKRVKQQAPFPSQLKCGLKFCSASPSHSSGEIPTANVCNQLCRPYYKDRAIPTINTALAASTADPNWNHLRHTGGELWPNSIADVDEAIRIKPKLCSHDDNNYLVSDAQVVRELGLPKPTPLLSRYRTFETAFEETPSTQTTTTSSSSSSYQDARNTISSLALPLGSASPVSISVDELNAFMASNNSDQQNDILSRPDAKLHLRKIPSAVCPTDSRQLLRTTQPPESALLELKGKSPQSLPRLHVPDDINAKSLSTSLPHIPFSRENDHISSFRPTLSRKSSKCSSSSGEVEVEGGLALTEEAIETGTPDIITQA